MSNLKQKSIKYSEENYIAKPLGSFEYYGDINKAFQNGYKDCQKEYEEKLKKAISALKIEINYPECTLTNSRGDTFTFKNNSKNEDFIDFISQHEKVLASFL